MSVEDPACGRELETRPAAVGIDLEEQVGDEPRRRIGADRPPAPTPAAFGDRPEDRLPSPARAARPAEARATGRS